MRNFLISLTRNPIGLLGVAIATASVLMMGTLFALELVGHQGSPYTGILTYLILPGVFLLGLLLIPIGVWRDRMRQRREESGEKRPAFPIFDLNSDRTRRVFLVLLVVTMLNIVILATATYKGVEVMESSEFCGQVCHVMDPEHTVYQNSPHARVECVDCHIGPGADWFVKSKLSGAWQVVSVAFDLYPRPIPTPIHNLRPARETCEQCHWPTKFVGDRLKVLTHYSENEENTEQKTVLLLRVGGIEGRVSQGIHWHVDPNIRIRYRSDETRELIGDVELTREDGSVLLYRSPSAVETTDGSEADVSQWREMDCIDCHNRPSHIYRMPAQEIDHAIQQRRIDRTLPYIRREGLRALQGDYESHDDARAKISAAVLGFYDETYPELSSEKSEQIRTAATVLGEIYAANVFPEMKVDWGTYPNHIGHQHFEGCFRCHNDEHETDGGEVISQDCDVCHTLLAMEEENPEVLQMLNP